MIVFCNYIYFSKLILLENIFYSFDYIHDIVQLLVVVGKAPVPASL